VSIKASHNKYSNKYLVSRQNIKQHPVQEKLLIRGAVDGTPESAVRAGTLGSPMALAAGERCRPPARQSSVGPKNYGTKEAVVI
jgi:hypothetical protein